MRPLLVALFALALLGTAPSAQAQTLCWDTGCAAGTPAADCWRAWCVDGWSYPAYPYRAAGWYRADLPSAVTGYTELPYAGARTRIDLLPTTPAGWCARSAARGDLLGLGVWGC